MASMRASSQYYGDMRGPANPPSPPVHHLFFLAVIVGMFMMFSLYMSYESRYESFFDQVGLVVMASPVVILLAVHWLSAKEHHRPSSSSGFSAMPRMERNAIHRAGGSPWGVGLLLVFLMFMISYQSQLQDRAWFPIWRRSY